jgi:hypothetical protein
MKRGILAELFTRNQSTICKEQLINIQNVPDEELSLRGCAIRLLKVQKVFLQRTLQVKEMQLQKYRKVLTFVE